jgi:hypothetical protein
VARKKDRASDGRIQELLAERKRIEGWLVRLDKAGDRAPDGVRTRVRGDYETRLATVVKELQGYQEDLRSSLSDVQTRLGAARREEKQATEELAEAELRHSVGEFGESEWGQKKTSILDRLIGIRESLAQAEEEIGELEEVLGSIAEPAVTERAVEPAVKERQAATEPEPEIAELDEIEEPELEGPAGRPPPKGPPGRITLGSELGLRDLPSGKVPAPPARKDAKPQTDAFGDEMAFLKALSDDGATITPPPPTPAPAVRPEPVPAASVPTKGERPSEPHPVSRSRPSVINQRTLKCGECGAMNLPTEWYCDRCGAELASL